jgi:hypothetical protein
VWNCILEQTKWTEKRIRDERYLGVIHLVSAADGAEGFYSSENNKARYETSE